MGGARKRKKNYPTNEIECLSEMFTHCRSMKYIRVYICNELIEETGRHRKLIFGMWESFGYGTTKF